MTKKVLFLFSWFLLGLTLPGLAQNAQQKGQNLFNLGVYAYESGDYQTAEDCFTRALSFEKNNAYAHYYLGKVYLQAGDYEQAAVYLEKAVGLDPDLPDLAYNWAYLHYKRDNFPVAADLFAKLTAAEPDNALAHYYAGMTSYKQAQYEPALQSFRKTAQLKTAVRYNADYWAGMCSLQLRNVVAAKETLMRVKEKADDDDLRRAAADLLERIRENERRKRRYSLVAKVGWEYDDNEVLEPVDNNDLYAHEEDHILSGYVSGAYDIVKTDNFVLGAGYSHYVTLHDDFDEFDLTGSLLDLYARYRIGNYTFSLSYNPDYYWLDSESYLCRNEVKATISREFGAFLAELSGNHQRDNNMYDSDQDGYANEVFFRSRYTLPEDRGSLRAGLGYEKNHADHDDYDYDVVSTELAVSFNIGWGLTLGLCGECEMKKYEHPHSTYGRLRDDTKYTGNVLLSRNLFDDRVSAHAGYEYTKNNSDIDDFGQYNQNYEYESKAAKIFLTVKL